MRRSMRKPVLVCAADLAHLPEVRADLEAAFDVRWLDSVTAESLARALPEADAYFATLAVRLTEGLIAQRRG